MENFKERIKVAVITPNTDVILLTVPLEISDDHQLTFSDATAQYNYFYNLPNKLVFDTKFTYQRKDNTIKVEYPIDELYSYNYVMYRNTSYSNKWFYAYITNIEYVSDKVTSLTLKTDVWQTWQFQLTFKPVLIDREHTNDDTVGANTLPEGLELGEMVCNGDVTDFGVNITGIGDWVIVVDVSMIENPGTEQTLSYSWIGDTDRTPSMYVNGIPSGLYHIIIGVNSSVVTSARAVIDVYDKAGLSDAIQNVYILPRDLIGEVEFGLTLSTMGSAPSASVGGLAMPKYSQGVTTLGNYTYARATSIRGYVPKNNKLFCYPYNYLNVSNNAGTTTPFHYEDFSGNVTFKVEGVMTPSGSTKAIPVDYKHISNSENCYDYSISGAKYPMCAWTTDSYTNWLTQNAVNMRSEWTSALVAGAVAIGAGAISGGLGAAAAGLTVAKAAGFGAAQGGIQLGGDLIGVAREQHLAKTQANLVADQSHGNANAGDIVWSKLHSQFTFIPMSIKPEYARCIDEYFSQYGYKCNRVKIPNLTGRRNWNYVKTVGCYIHADIPQDDLAEIKALFDKGITLWHNPATFADYSQNNDII